MTSTLLERLADSYHWDLSLYAFIGIAIATRLGGFLARQIPTVKAAMAVNDETRARKMEKSAYAANQRKNMRWGLFFNLTIFALIMPFCLTLDAQPLWKMALDVFIILMFYDFFYYLTHRFVFHDNGFFGGPLLSVHAVHHRQHNPCRQDSSYLNPVETAVGLYLYAGSILLLAHLMGPFHVATIIVTFVTFTQINLHNHNLWESDRFPFRYLNFASKMHHNHHRVFTGGNFATISPLYDWMFGTLDYGLDPVKKPFTAQKTA